MAFHFDEARSDDAIRFVKALRHTQGAQFAGRPFNLLDWQETLLSEIFGWVDDKGYRQYRTVYVEVPKKNGKTELAAALALKLLVADHEIGAEVYSAAQDREQASKVFNAAADMVSRNKILKKRLKIIRSQKRIVDYSTNSFYHALSSEVHTKHGLNISGLVIDELHAIQDRNFIDVLTEGSGAARKQPLTFIITTAGIPDQKSVCWEFHQRAEKIRDGVSGYDDERFLPFIFGLDPDEDWEDESLWRRANPSMGEILDIEEMRNAFREAKQVPSKENSFRRLRLNQWTSQVTRFIPMSVWKSCSEPVNLSKGTTWYGGIDLSSNTDLTALVLVSVPDENGCLHVSPHFFMPEENLEQRVHRDKVKYDVWARQKLINLTPGDVIDQDFIKQKIKDLREYYDIREIAYDRWGMPKLATDLQNEGVVRNEQLFPMGQGFASMTAPTKELLTLLMKKKIRHGGHPILEWMASNVAVKQDPAGNIKPDKSKSTERIDGIVAMIMAIDRVIRQPGLRSIYEDVELMVI